MWKDKGFSRLVLYAIRETTSFTNTLWDICKSYSTDYQVSDRETGLWNRRDSNETDSGLYHDKKQAPLLSLKRFFMNWVWRLVV